MLIRVRLKSVIHGYEGFIGQERLYFCSKIAAMFNVAPNDTLLMTISEDKVEGATRIMIPESQDLGWINWIDIEGVIKYVDRPTMDAIGTFMELSHDFVYYVTVEEV